MTLPFAEAYAEIKNLENTGLLDLPEPRDTVVMGTIDPSAGTFTWAVPTVVQTTSVPPIPPGKTNIITNVTVGIVKTDAVDLQLKFAVIPQKPVAQQVAMLAAHPLNRAGVAAVGHLPPAGLAGGLLAETNGGVTISGFPTVVSAAEYITLDAGRLASVATGDIHTTPAVSRFGVTIDIPGHDSIDVEFFILRPPVLGMGAFTVPALPVAIVYAPPQGIQKKNSANYSDTESFTRTVTTSSSTSTNTKTMQAYKPEDLMGKVAGAIGQVIALGATAGGGAAGPSVVGAMEELGAALFGQAKQDVGWVSDAAKGLQSDLALVSGIVQGFDGSPTSSDGGTITTQDDHSIALTLSQMASYGAEAGLGPGQGDRVVYMKDVKLLWVVLNGEVDISVLGFEGVGANAVQDLIDEQASLAAGKPPRLGLDLKTIKALLKTDPLVRTANRVTDGIHVGPPVVGPPRFVPADPPGRSGSGTSSDGDQWQITVDTVEETKQTHTASDTTVVDDKPGWLDVMFGADNTETVTTTTFTTSQTTDEKTESKLTLTIKMYSVDESDAYDVKCFHDLLFGGYVILNSDSELLEGSIIQAEQVMA